MLMNDGAKQNDKVSIVKGLIGGLVFLKICVQFEGEGVKLFVFIHQTQDEKKPQQVRFLYMWSVIEDSNL